MDNKLKNCRKLMSKCHRKALFFILFLFLGIPFFQPPSLATQESLHPTQNFDPQLFQGLKPVSPDVFQNLKKIDPLIFKENTNRENVLQMTLPKCRDFFNFLIQHDWGSMSYFAHPFFIEDPRILYYDKELLSVVTQEFQVPSLFKPNGRMLKAYKEEGQNPAIPKGTFFELDGLLQGGGQVVALYSHPVSVHRTDHPFDYLTGNFELYRVNIARIESQIGGTYALKDFKGRNHPEHPLKNIDGPLNISILNMTLSENWQDVTIQTNLLNRMFLHPKFKKIIPPLYERPPLASDIPPVVRERARNLAQKN